jgi:hypothetical protein
VSNEAFDFLPKSIRRGFTRKTRIKPFQAEKRLIRVSSAPIRVKRSFCLFPEKPLPRIHAEDADKAFQAKKRLIRVSSAPIRVKRSF